MSEGAGKGPSPAPVIVADDEPDIVLLWEAMLRQTLGASIDLTSVLLASDLVDLVEGGMQPDLILMGHNFPVMNGVEAVTRLRAIGHGGAVIVCSAVMTDEARASYAALDVDAVLSKSEVDAMLAAATAAIRRYPPARLEELMLGPPVAAGLSQNVGRAPCGAGATGW